MVHFRTFIYKENINMLKTLKYIIMFSLVFVSYTVSATHAAGMDISYECITRGSTSDSYNNANNSTISYRLNISKKLTDCN